MEEPLRGRAKPKKLRVRFPDGVEFCYSSAKETFLETLRKIGGRKLSAVKFEVCHLPMFSKTVYELYKDFMEPVGDGWYVNTQGDTYNKYVQLKTINEQLNLGLEIDMSENFKGQRVSRGSKGMAVLEVTLPDHTVIGEENTADTFMQCIWHLGVDNVRNLNLQHGGKDLITTAKLYRGQVQVDVDRWLVVPAALKDKVKILRVISAMLHIKMDITFFSTSEGKSYKRIGNKNSHKKSVVNTTKDVDKEAEGKFQIGDKVYSEKYGEGRILEYNNDNKKYSVQFYVKYRYALLSGQIYNVREDSLSLISHSTLPTSIKHDYEVIKNTDNFVKSNSSTQTTSKTVVPKFKIGDYVYCLKLGYGSGKVLDHIDGTRIYKVMFPSLSSKGYNEENVRFINEKDLYLDNKDSVEKRKLRTHSIENEDFPLKIGDRVYHEKYGEGRIVGINEYSNTYSVRFVVWYHDRIIYDETYNIERSHLKRI